jgi:hypothetical protein
MAAGERERGELSREAYQGTLGRTRTETVQVWMPDGSIRALSVYVAVDAEADPGLATLARAGGLHNVGEGVELALPFVYHEPSARLMVLVVPEGLRHRALSARAEHLGLIAADSAHSVPDYVRDAEVVIGVRALCERIASGSPVPKLHSVTQGAEEDLKALSQRERELARRERLLRAREQALLLAEGGRPRPHLVFAAAAQGVDDGELEEVEETLLLHYERALVEAELAPSNEVEAVSEEVDVAELSEVSLAGGTARFDERASSREPAEELAEDLDPAEDVDDDALEEEVEEDLPEEDELPSFVVPSGFVEDAQADLWLCENDGRVWLFVRRRPAPPRDASDLELLLQLDPSLETPVALITLVFDVAGTPELRRGAIDPQDPAQVRALTLLGEHFEVELVSLSDEGDFEPWACLSAAREGNARAILSRLTRKEELDPARYRHAREAALRTPPPWREPAHPFQPSAEGVAQTATEAAVQLDELGAWLKPDRRERLRLLWCVPDELVDDHAARVLGAALDWGISLSEPLSARAIELGLSHDARALLERRLHGLCRASRAPEDAGLEQAVLRTLWLEALEQAAKLGVTLSSEAQRLAHEHAGERAMSYAEALSDTSSAALLALRERALSEPFDPEVLAELLSRGAHRDLVLGCRALAKVSAEQAGKLFARVALRNDPAAVDALLSLLSEGEETRVRVGGALALAHRRALSAIEGIAENLAREDGPAWRLFALALGRYGGGSFRAVSRALLAQRVDAQRTVLVYALLCCHGARAQLRAKARSGDFAEAELAERALELSQTARSDESLLMELEPGGDLAVFCAIFDSSCAALPI